MIPLSCSDLLQTEHWACILCVSVFMCFFPFYMWSDTQWRTPVQRRCWGSCRRRGPARCAWTSWCPSSSSPVDTWWCVAIVLPACVTAPSAEPSSGAASVPSCPEAALQVLHEWPWVFLLYSFPPLVLIRIKSAGCLCCQSSQTIFYNKHFWAVQPFVRCCFNFYTIQISTKWRNTRSLKEHILLLTNTYLHEHKAQFRINRIMQSDHMGTGETQDMK